MNWKVNTEHDGPSNSPGFVLWSTFLHWQKGLNTELRSFGLTQPQFAILAVCSWLARDGDYPNQQTVSNFTGLDRMTISQILSNLSDLKLVDRVPSIIDARSKIIKVTDIGLVKLKETIAIVENYDKNFFIKKINN